MAEALPLLRREQRRHVLSNGGLAIAALAAAFLITNERGVFQPVGPYDSALANAFSALTAPNPLNLVGVKRVLPLRPGGAGGPGGLGVPGEGAPGDRDLGRRLTDALDSPTGPEGVLGTGEPGVDQAFGGPTGAGAGNTPGVTTQDIGTPSAFVPSPPPGVIAPPVVPPSMDVPGPVPEPAIWMSLIAGFGIVGVLLRRRRRGMVSA